ncbi:radical SAM protein, partial [Bacteroidota bacterium]
MPVDIDKILKSCTLCPRECKVDRTESSSGICRMGAALKISSYGPHYGEEPELVGLTASGTIFLTGCSLLCDFCQNHHISHERNGRFTDEDTLVEIMLNLQNIGAANINFVTPTHFSPQLISAEAIRQHVIEGI